MYDIKFISHSFNDFMMYIWFVSLQTPLASMYEFMSLHNEFIDNTSEGL